MKEDKLFNWKINSAIVWLFFTVSLASWWMVLGLKYSGPKKSMIVAEGLTLIVLLAGGGIALIYYILQERRRNFKLNRFFASANHELKTYMASLRLRAEGLSEDLEGRPESLSASKIVRDTVRLELQLENSLIFSEPKDRQLFIEDINISNYLDEIVDQWPNIKIIFAGELCLKADRRLLDVIVKNLIQNAIVHGEASAVNFELGSSSIVVTNNGKEFIGDLMKLGEMFYRHQHKSRSGIGLHLVKTLVESLGGKTSFELAEDKTLKVKMVFNNV